MSDDATGDLDFNEITDKIKKHAKFEVCPFCQNKNWYILGGTGIDKGISRITITLSQFVSAYTLCCQSCGFVRQHVKEIIDGEIRPTEEKK